MLRGHSLKNLVEQEGVYQVARKLRNLLDQKKVKPEDFSIKEIAEAFCGHRWVQRLHESNLDRYGTVPLREAGDGVDVSAFANITGQLIFSKIHQGWEQVEKICDQLFTTVPTVLDGEIVPGIGRITNVGNRIHPGQPYPEAQFGQQYWNTPSTDKHGEIVSLTKEVIFFDRTGLVLKRAAEAGERLSYNKEIRCLACLAGLTVNVGENESFAGNNHSWNGDTYNTYSTTNQTGATSGGIIYPNAVSGQDLIDWTQLEQAWLLFQNQLDPNTGLPINIRPTTLIVMPFKNFTAMRMVRATEVRSGAVATSEPSGPGPQQTISINPFDSTVVGKVMMSRLLYQQIIGATSGGAVAANAKYWFFYGDPQKAFEYRENWPLTTMQAPPNSEADFTRDIVVRYKASERGVPWVADPRYMVKGYNS